MSDTELPLQITEETFANLVRRYAGLVYSTAKRRIANAALAEDIAQIVFIRLARKPPKLRSHAELAAWLHRTAVNVTIDLWRSETRRRARELQAVTMEPESSETAVWEDVCPRLDDALNQLPDEDRQALLLRFFNQKTMREVGSALGVSEDAAKMRVSRAVDRLRTQLGVGAVTCTAALLSDLLLEHTAEAAPSQLVSRLTSIKPSAATGASIGNGIIASLLQVSKLKLTCGAVALAVIAVGVVHLLQSLNEEAPAGPSATSQEIPSASQPVASKRLEPHPQATGFDSVSLSPATNAEVTFKVVDSETGTGVAGAKIHIYVGGVGSEGKSRDLLTSPSGTAAIPEEPGSHGMNVFVVADGYVPKVVGWQNGPFTNYTMKLDSAVMASGWVVDQQGQPVAGTTLQIQGPGNTGQVENVDFQTCSATTDERGHWNYDYVPRDFTNTVSFILKKNGYATTYPWVPVARTGLENVVLVLDSGSTVTGHVTDSQDEPITNALVKVLSNSGKEQSEKTDQYGHFSLAGVAGTTLSTHEPPLETNESGLFVIHGLAADGQRHVDLTVQADGFAPQNVSLPLSDSTNAVSFRLSPGNVFCGRVVDEAGNPVSNAVVETDWNDQGVRAFDWQTRTDADGRFKWNSAPAAPTLFWFQADGYQWRRDVSLVADATDHEITLKRSQ